MGKLILLRHGESEYNEKGLWTGWDEPNLDLNGVEEVDADSQLLSDIHLDVAYTSIHRRVKETLEELKIKLFDENIPTIESPALNERDYGIYDGKNKWDVKKEVGEETFQKLRRSWDYPIPQGESLKQVYERVVPYYKKEILPKVTSGKNVLIASSGNALRALVKYLDNIPDDKVGDLEIAPGEILIYTTDEHGKIVLKEIRGNKKNSV